MLKKKKSKGQRIELKVEINMRDGTKLEEFMEKRIIPISEKYPYMKIHIGVRYQFSFSTSKAPMREQLIV